MNSPKLSIILPIYNVEKYIIRCLSSIFANDFKQDDIELLLVDDASPDGTIKRALAWLSTRNASNFRIIRQENKGLGGARNTGIRNASAPWLWFIDSDDEITPNAIPMILSRLNDKLDFITFNYISRPGDTTGYNLTTPEINIEADDLTS